MEDGPWILSFFELSHRGLRFFHSNEIHQKGDLQANRVILPFHFVMTHLSQVRFSSFSHVQRNYLTIETPLVSKTRLQVVLRIGFVPRLMHFPNPNQAVVHKGTRWFIRKNKRVKQESISSPHNQNTSIIVDSLPSINHKSINRTHSIGTDSFYLPILNETKATSLPNRFSILE